MPDKNCKKGCGTSCLRCWRNKLKHANPETKAYIKKHKIELGVEGSDDYDKAREEYNQKKFLKEERKRKMTDKLEGCKIIKSDYQV